METVAVCLYSKYSQRCKEFLDDLHPSMGVQMLCIDNETVRKSILQDQHGYNIKTVPCVFLFYPNGRLEKYEGSDAFTWLRKMLDILESQRQPQPQQTTMIAPPVQQQPQSFVQPPPQQQQAPVPQQTTLIQPPTPEQLQRLQQTEEAFEIMEVEENGIQPQPQPPNNPEDIINREMELRRASDQIITRKQENIKELAQMMQRQRESDDDKIAPPALYPKDSNRGF